MRETGQTAHWVSLILVAGGLTLMFAALVRTDSWKVKPIHRPLRIWLSASMRQQYRKLRGRDEAQPADIPELRTMAEALIKNRWLSLFTFGAVVGQVGQAITEGPLWRGLVAGFVVLVAGLAGLTEVQARVGEAFLRSHPAPGAPEP
jgi:hypothetical protein